ncbi:DUF1259 domain-containing protein [Nitrosospira multiformis]|uniref:DUF1259 domain-containing protein n=1 Tax=Nitrosospira TaxID=35798 RepID=UPI0009BCDFAB
METVVDGDFAVLENQLRPILEILRAGNINIVAIHQHITVSLLVCTFSTDLIGFVLLYVI